MQKKSTKFVTVKSISLRNKTEQMRKNLMTRIEEEGMINFCVKPIFYFM